MPSGSFVVNSPLDRSLARRADFGLFVLRLAVGGHPAYMTLDNVTSWARMLEFRDFLAQFGFPIPLACAVVSVAAQFGGGVAVVFGWQTRLAAILLAINFIVAVVMVDARAPYPAAFPALALVAGAICLACTGPGRWSIDGRARGRR